MAVSCPATAATTLICPLSGLGEWEVSWADALGNHTGTNPYTSVESDIAYFNMNSYYEDLEAQIAEHFDYYDARGVQVHVTLSEASTFGGRATLSATFGRRSDQGHYVAELALEKGEAGTHYHAYYTLEYHEGILEQSLCSGSLPFEMIETPNEMLRIIRWANNMKFQLPHRDVSVTCKVRSEQFDEDFLEISLGSEAKGGHALHSAFRDLGLFFVMGDGLNNITSEKNSTSKQAKKVSNGKMGALRDKIAFRNQSATVDSTETEEESATEE